VPDRWEYCSEGQELNDEVGKKILEFAVQPTPQHDRGDSHLQDGMCDPERVIKELNSLGHVAGIPTNSTVLGSTAKPFCISVRTCAFLDR